MPTCPREPPCLGVIHAPSVPHARTACEELAAGRPNVGRSRKEVPRGGEGDEGGESGESGGGEEPGGTAGPEGVTERPA
ncbi:hypothetical protein [Sorangium cellulosum]|uniref:hypothetical protein n=1 Tax=Sorangium cellulosum TaxID=56 RepID=UPI0011DC7E2E|nr:hypothetical protein [Sorangium cellulosum]